MIIQPNIHILLRLKILNENDSQMKLIQSYLQNINLKFEQNQSTFDQVKKLGDERSQLIELCSINDDESIVDVIKQKINQEN